LADRVPFTKTHRNREIGNIPGLPKEAVKGCRKDMKIGTLLDKWHVTTIEELKKKLRREHRLKKFRQPTD